MKKLLLPLVLLFALVLSACGDESDLPVADDLPTTVPPTTVPPTTVPPTIEDDAPESDAADSGAQDGDVAEEDGAEHADTGDGGIEPSPDEGAPDDAVDLPIPASTLTTGAFIGLSEADAAQLAESEGLPWRTVRIDDEYLAATMDFMESRVNLELDAGIVTAVTLG